MSSTLEVDTGVTTPSENSGRGVEVVVKLGGSLVERGAAGPLLDVLCRSRAPIALVPGGGAFADAVRDAQKVMGFSDRAAHHMAILAMEQMALVLLDMQPGLASAEEQDDFAAILDAGRVPIWLPGRMTRHDCTIPADWSITSDGLAARLAERVGARRIVLLKAMDTDPGASLEDLARAGVIDPAFGPIVARGGLDWAVVGPGGHERLAILLSGAPGNAAPPAGR